MTQAIFFRVQKGNYEGKPLVVRQFAGKVEVGVKEVVNEDFFPGVRKKFPVMIIGQKHNGLPGSAIVTAIEIGWRLKFR